jgi:tetratricopeptide (TPR) repeat protein
MEKIYLTILLPMVFFSSCSLGKTGMDIMFGNYSFQKGNYQKAMVYYLRALEEEEFSGLIEYNLGNLYFSLGEPETAMEAWENADSESDLELLFRIYFNKGIYFYEKGMFRDAFESYKSALVLKPQDIDAKINLELSYRKILSAERIENKPQTDTRELEDNSQRVLQYVQRKEELFWSERNRDQSESKTGKGW